MNPNTQSFGHNYPVFIRLSLIILILSFVSLEAQTPAGFNFQAVARDGASNLITNTDVLVSAGIRFGSESGELLWEEAHSVSTNEFGLFNIIICGDETLKTGGSLSSPGEISWSSGDHFIDLSIKKGDQEVSLGVHQLLPVPYSLSAAALSQSLTSLSVQGDNSLPDGEALFIVRRKDGYPVFAVYEDSVWVYTDTATNKGVKGGFAVGGYRKTAKGQAREYMRVTPDNVSFNIDQGDGTVKGVKGGFAVGGYRKTAKGNDFNFLSLTPENYFIGQEAGANNTTGLYNSFIGYQAGKANSKGHENIFIGYMAGFSNIGLDPDGGVPELGGGNCYIGYQAGYSSKYGDHNTMIGHAAGFNNTASRNTFIGYQSGYNNTEGSYNTFLGLSAGMANETGRSNIFIGHQAGYSNVDGEYNVLLGTVAGAGMKSGINNVIIGSKAMAGSVYAEDGSGSSNVILGYEAGQYAKNGSNNIFIGHQAGKNELGSNKLYISNSEATAPLIWGDFEQKNLVVNGNAADNPEKMIFYVNGSSGGTLSWNTVSDARLKTDIVPIPQALEKVLDLQGVLFSWKETEMQDLGRQMGFVAQQAESVIPEVVSYKGDRYSMQYAPITALLVEAIKEQQKIIEQKEVEMDVLKARLDRLEKLILSD